MNVRQVFIAAGCCCLLSGCASLLSNMFEVQMYGGVKYDLDTLRGKKDGLSLSLPGKTIESPVFSVIDLPFSAAMDTLLLPLWVPERLRTIGKTMKDRHDALAQNVRQSKPYVATKAKLDELEQNHLERTVGRGQTEPPVNDAQDVPFRSD